MLALDRATPTTRKCEAHARVVSPAKVPAQRPYHPLHRVRASSVVCQADGGARKLSQAARDYAAGQCASVWSATNYVVRNTQQHIIYLTGRSSAGIREGIDEDDLVAVQLGKAKAAQLSEVQQKYKDKVKQKLAEVACSYLDLA